MRLKTFRKGDEIPEGARFVRTEEREIPGSGREQIMPPRGLLSFLGITEVVGWVVKVETVYVYEVP